VKLDDIRRAVRALPAVEQLELRARLGWMPESADLIIEVHDWKGADRAWPRAVILRSDRSREEIDILASVKRNAASIAHPAIICAIKRWEEIVICQGALPIVRNLPASDSDVEYFVEETEKVRAERLRSGLTRADYDRLLLNKRRQDFHERTGQHINFARIAKGHLKNLSMSLIEGAESRAWSKEQAFDVYRHTVFGASHKFLELTYLVWSESREPGVSKLMTKVIERFRNYGFGNERLGSPLSEEVIERLQMGFDDVRAFLKSGPGKRALHGRREWKIWKQAFDVWRFPSLKPSTQRIYHKKAKDQSTRTEVSRRSLTPKLNWYQLSDTSGFELPTVPPKR
jgi:hypothetical protein